MAASHRDTRPSIRPTPRGCVNCPFASWGSSRGFYSVPARMWDSCDASAAVRHGGRVSVGARRGLWGWLLVCTVAQSVGWRGASLPQEKGRERCQGAGRVPKGECRVPTRETVPCHRVLGTLPLPYTLPQRPSSRIAAVFLPRASHNRPLTPMSALW